MKVYYNADIDARKFEGRTSIAIKIKEFMEKKGFTFTNNVEEADLMHFHSSGIFEAYTACKLKKKYKIPCIYSLYSNSKTEVLRHFQNFFIQRWYFEKTATNGILSYSAILPIKLRGYFLKKLDSVVSPLECLKRRLFNNTELIRIGIDVNKFKPRKKKSDKVKVAFFGHPGVFKGVNDFVTASKKFSSDLEIYMFMTKKTKKIERNIKKINPRIKVYGFVEDIKKAYNDMDIVVLPYRTSIGTIANPLVLLECMASGKAIITTNLDFIKEIVRDSAIRVRSCCPNKLVKAVNRLSKDSVLRGVLGEKARGVAVKYYNQNDMMEQYHSLYKKYENT